MCSIALGKEWYTSRKQGFRSGLASPFVPVWSPTVPQGGIRPGSSALGAGRASRGICPGSSGIICPGWLQEPGAMGLAPGPTDIGPGSWQEPRKMCSALLN